MQKNGHPFTNKTKIRFILNRQANFVLQQNNPWFPYCDRRDMFQNSELGDILPNFTTLL